MNNLETFLEFDGKSISILLADGSWWIAIKPICEALNIQYERQFKNLKDDDILSELLAEQLIVAGDGKIRKMLCLPEKFIYGWLFSIRSESENLKNYKKKCYEVLFDYFHGALTFRINLLNEKTDIDLEIEDLKEKLDQQHLASPEYQRIQDLTRKKKKIVKTLKEQDNDLGKGQTSFIFN